MVARINGGDSCGVVVRKALTQWRRPPVHTRSARARAVSVIAVGLAVAACSPDQTSTTGPAAAANGPAITNLTASANPFNVLSTIVTFTVTGADSARVIYISENASTVDAGRTPFAPVRGDSGRIVVLGLLPNTAYVETLQVWGGGRAVLQSVHVPTADLSPYLKKISLHITGTFGPGYTIVSPTIYPAGDSVVVLAFDAAGRVRWYRCFPPGTGGAESKQQPNGHFTVALGGSAGFGGVPEEFVEFLASGEQVATYTAPPGMFTDPHDLLLTGDSAHPTAHLFGYTQRPFDFSSLGGPSNGIGDGHQVLRILPGGAVDFQWDAWDHYTIADWIEPTGVNPPNDFDHPNALAFDLDSNYLVSFRHLGAIVKLNAKTGETMWQFGGLQNQFALTGDPLGGFSGQHGLRVLPNGHLLVYDNGLRHNPPHSRAAEYAVDPVAHTATMVWEYEPSEHIFTSILGSVERLPSGNTLVGFGQAGQIHEVTPSGQAVGIATFLLDKSPVFYRAIRIQSLYKYIAP
jgi:hypothetical protein